MDIISRISYTQLLNMDDVNLQNKNIEMIKPISQKNIQSFKHQNKTKVITGTEMTTSTTLELSKISRNMLPGSSHGSNMKSSKKKNISRRY